MKKFGLTLAETLITLGVIGVIATLTIPNTIGKAGNIAQIGPKLAKAVSNFEQANQTLLTNNGIERLTDKLDEFGTVYRYLDELGIYLKFTSLGKGQIMTKDGISFTIAYPSAAPANTQDPAYKQKIGTVLIDINGPNNNPNRYGKDWFTFSWWNDGSLRPKGAANWNESADSQIGGKDYWQKHCPADSTPTDYSYCAGHIFENNLRVLYK